jgi:ribosomal protein S9
VAERIYATGKEDAIARVWMEPGEGKVTVNESPEGLLGK